MPVEDATDAEIIEALEKLARDAIDAGTFVILEADTARNYYVQFAVQDGGMYCEAVSNQYLAPEHQLDAEQTTALEGLGWREGEYDGQNWVRSFMPSREAFAETVGLVRQALTEVYGLPEGVPLRMTRSWDGQVLAAESAIEFAHGYTYSGHPLACAAALGTLDTYADEGLLTRALDVEGYFAEALHSLKGLPHVIDIRNLGLMGGIEFQPVAGSPGKRAYDVFLACWERGVLVRMAGDVIALSPPLIVERSHIDQIVATLADAIKRVA
jgi:hypothetical protein